MRQQQQQASYIQAQSAGLSHGVRIDPLSLTGSYMRSMGTPRLPEGRLLYGNPGQNQRLSTPNSLSYNYAPPGNMFPFPVQPQNYKPDDKKGTGFAEDGPMNINPSMANTSPLTPSGFGGFGAEALTGPASSRALGRGAGSPAVREPMVPVSRDFSTWAREMPSAIAEIGQGLSAISGPAASRALNAPMGIRRTTELSSPVTGAIDAASSPKELGTGPKALYPAPVTSAPKTRSQRRSRKSPGPGQMSLF